MKPHEIEHWVLKMVERLASGQPIEDSRVELKSAWIPPEKACRQIAGHANAARGEPILWIIGIDEKTGVIGARQEELSTWYPQVKSWFNGLAPTISSLNVPVNDRTVVALLFDTDRAPYLVVNPTFGRTGGGPVAFEVPWRENNATRTASRADLIKILAPIQKLPVFEVLEGQLVARPESRNNEPFLNWSLDLKLYAETEGLNRLVIPFHKCLATYEIPGGTDVRKFEEIHIRPPEQMNYRELSATSMSLTIKATRDEVIIDGPGKMLLFCTESTPRLNCKKLRKALVTVSLRPVLSDFSAPLALTLEQDKEGPDGGWRWVYQG